MDISFGKKKDDKSGGIQATGTGELRGSLRKMEQNIDSLSKRLDAIERRLSDESFEGTTMDKGEGSSQNVGKRMHQLSKEMESEIAQLQQEVEELKQAYKSPSREDGAEKRHSTSPTILKAGKKKSGGTSNINTKTVADLERRMEKLEGRKATVTVGRIEVPIEITGIVGGILAFLIAALLFQGYRGLVISPTFVVFLGVVLVLAAAFKTYLINMARR